MPSLVSPCKAKHDAHQLVLTGATIWRCIDDRSSSAICSKRNTSQRLSPHIASGVVNGNWKVVNQWSHHWRWFWLNLQLHFRIAWWADTPHWRFPVSLCTHFLKLRHSFLTLVQKVALQDNTDHTLRDHNKCGSESANPISSVLRIQCQIIGTMTHNITSLLYGSYQ